MGIEVSRGRLGWGGGMPVLGPPPIDHNESGGGGPRTGIAARDERQDVILDWAVGEQSGNTASPCIRSGARARNLIFHARVKARPKRDGTHLRARGRMAPG